MHATAYWWSFSVRLFKPLILLSYWKSRRAPVMHVGVSLPNSSKLSRLSSGGWESFEKTLVVPSDRGVPLQALTVIFGVSKARDDTTQGIEIHYEVAAF